MAKRYLACALGFHQSNYNILGDYFYCSRCSWRPRGGRTQDETDAINGGDWGREDLAPTGTSQEPAK